MTTSAHHCKSLKQQIKHERFGNTATTECRDPEQNIELAIPMIKKPLNSYNLWPICSLATRIPVKKQRASPTLESLRNDDDDDGDGNNNATKQLYHWLKDQK